LSALILGLIEEYENSNQVVKSLELLGHQVVVVDTYTKAMAILEQPNSITLIISDVHLENGGNVFDFLRWIKRNQTTSHIPFVLFSSRPTDMAKHLEDGLRTSARMLGAAMYISMHQFDSTIFGKMISSLLPKTQTTEQKTNSANLNKDIK
jgi:CheY-like chemotaxis protein